MFSNIAKVFDITISLGFKQLLPASLYNQSWMMFMSEAFLTLKIKKKYFSTRCSFMKQSHFVYCILKTTILLISIKLGIMLYVH